jgi:hypothetical protein
MECGYCHEQATEWMEWRTTGRPKGAPVCPAHRIEHDTPDNWGHHPTFTPLETQ